MGIFKEEIIEAERLMKKGLIIDTPEIRAQIKNLMSRLPKGNSENKTFKYVLDADRSYENNIGRSYSTEVILSRENGQELGYSFTFEWEKAGTRTNAIAVFNVKVESFNRLI